MSFFFSVRLFSLYTVRRAKEIEIERKRERERRRGKAKQIGKREEEPKNGKESNQVVESGNGKKRDGRET